jgi:hypothetical protein
LREQARYIWSPADYDFKNINFFPAKIHPEHGWMVAEVVVIPGIVDWPLTIELNKLISEECHDLWVEEV